VRRLARFQVKRRFIQTENSGNRTCLAKPGPFSILHRLLPDFVWRGLVGSMLKAG